MLIPNSDLDFWNPDPKIHFGQTWGEKAKSPFCLKIGKHGLLEDAEIYFKISFLNFSP